MNIKLIILILIISASDIYSQEIKPDLIKLEPLNWDIMYCGNTYFGKNKPATLYVKNETDFPIQGYWLNYHNNLAKVKFGKIAPRKTKKLNLKANEYWVFSDLNNNALGVFQTIAGINEIIINKSSFKNSVKLPTSIQDKSIAGTKSGGQVLKEQAAYDVLSYDLKLEIFPEKKFIKGKNIITAKTIESISDFVFDLDSLLTIENVFLLGKSKKSRLPIETINGKHWCKLPAIIKKGNSFNIAVEYSGNPRIATHAPYKGGFSWNQTKDCKPWIATSCQMDGADLWIPCKDYQWDEPETVNLSFTVPNGLKAISNGILIDEIKNKNKTTTYNWKVVNPINNYNISLNIAPYIYIQDSYVSITNDKLNLGYWVLPENVDGAKEFYGYSKKYLAFLENHLGPYPFRKEKLGIIEVPFVAMEHQTIIAYGPNTTLKYPEYNATVFHEICHEWFGNMVTAKYWKDFWIHESLDAYMEALYEESIQGKKAYEEKIKSFNWRLENKVPLAPETIANSRQLYSGDSYKKGAYLLHTLRNLIGK
jgi:aminopeptidase N